MKIIISLALGAAIGVGLTLSFTDLKPTQAMTEAEQEDSKEPMYWVAPMDPNFRRDEPGLSPMGMALVPVYQSQGGSQDGPGTVKISPYVENNLGVRTALVEQKALHIPINTVGYVKYNEDQLVHIHPRVEGWIEKLNVKAAGELVQANQVLYALYSPQLVNAQEEYLLAKGRNNQNLVAATEARLVALQMPKEAIALLKKSNKVQHTIEFRAPQSGVIDNLNIRQGFYVKPGTTLMSIGSLDEVWVEAEIFERQAAQVSVGLKVTMTLGFMPGKVWQGQLDYIYPTLDAQNRTIRVRLRFANEQRLLKPNMFAQLTIHSDLADQTLLVPREAVIRTGQQDRVVLALGEGKFKSVEVILGQLTSNYAQIIEGLEVGDRVVSSAQFLLDSESSISSDFKRTSQPADVQSKSQEHDMNSMDGMDMSTEDDAQAASASASVDGIVNSIDAATRVMNISRGPIEKWGRKAATMDFYVSDAVKLDIFRPKDKIHFTFEIQDGNFVVVEAIFVSANGMSMPDGAR